MKIVIDIPKKLFDEIQKSNFITVGQAYAKKVIDYIKNGTPLEQEPKHTPKNCGDCKYTGNPPHAMCKCCVNKNRYEPQAESEDKE